MSDEGNGEQREDSARPVQPSGWRLINIERLKNPPTAVAAFVYVAATLFGLAVLVLVAFGLFAAFQIAYETAVGKFTDRIEAAKVFFPILLALVGGPLLIWRVITAHIQAQATRHQAETGREAHYTTLFTKAVEQLGATREVKETIEIDDARGVINREVITKTEPNLEVRLGAIYALDRITRDSERDHWPIMQVLCAYVRNPQNCGAPAPPPEGIEPGSRKFHDWVESIRPPRVDIQAALAVIGERAEGRRELEASRSLQLDLRHTNLQRAVLNKSYFERATFEGAHLDGASFIQAHLDNAWFIEAHLDGASFDGAHLDDACFTGAHLGGASFHKAHLGGSFFKGTHLDGASFNEAHLDGASFFNVDLSKALRLEPVLLASAFGDASTRLPEGMEWPAAWPVRELSEDERDAWREAPRDPRPGKT